MTPESSLFVQMVQIPPQEMKKPELRNTSDRGRVVAGSLGEQGAGYLQGGATQVKHQAYLWSSWTLGQA